MRAVLIAVLVALMCCVGVSASSADWAAPADAWAPELSANELEGRHSEFMMALAASTGGPSAGVVPLTVTLKLNCTVSVGPQQCTFNVTALRESILRAYGFPKKDGESVEVYLEEYTYDDTASSSTGVSGRRLLEIITATRVVVIFRGAAVDSGALSKTTYSAFVASLQCAKGDNTCLNTVATKYGVTSLADDPAFTTLASETISVSGDAELGAGVAKTNNVESDGHSRRTNGGYYFLAAVLILFIVIALVYFIVHKAPVDTMAKSEPRRDEVDMAPVATVPAESQPIAGGDQQMDYRSVFALKNNVLDKSAEEKAADEHNHNDVHFILHQ